MSNQWFRYTFCLCFIILFCSHQLLNYLPTFWFWKNQTEIATITQCSRKMVYNALHLVKKKSKEYLKKNKDREKRPRK